MISKIVNETLEFKIMKENEDFIIWDFYIQVLQYLMKKKKPFHCYMGVEY